jgi:hypothetical protein
MTISKAHLTPEELIDLADGVRDEASTPHLGVCETCRQQLADVRASLAMVQDVDVPEPPPLFWTQLSRRVSDAVAAQEPSPRGWFSWLRPSLALPAAAAAFAIVLVAVLMKPPVSPSAPAPLPVASSATSQEPAPDSTDVATDSSLELVADLTAGIDLADAIDAGLTSRESAEHAVTHMSSDELAALQRLLKDAIARRGA